MLGADKIFMINDHQYRLDFAKKTYDVIPINRDQIEDSAKMIVEQTENRGVDAAIDAIGFEAKGSKLDTTLTTLKLETSSGLALRQCIACVRRGGIISVPGVYVGYIQGFLFGDAFDKGITFKMGQTHVQKIMPELLAAIVNGKLKPEIIITHRLPAEAKLQKDTKFLMKKKKIAEKLY